MQHTSKKFYIKIWSNHRYIDLWSLNHFLTGGVIAGISVLSYVPFLLSVIVLFLLLFLWEVYEVFKKIRETKSNRALDVALGLIGYSAIYSVMKLEMFNNVILVSIVTVLFAILSFWGWLAYKMGSSDDFLEKFK